jgi:hypothetical protein
VEDVLLTSSPATSGWQLILTAALGLNAASLFGYRLYRLSKGGPAADAFGGAFLAGLLVLLAVFLAAGAGWPRWAALAYAVLFTFVVMPIWTLAVLIPLPPKAVDMVFTVFYWGSLVVIGAAAVVL